jgi:hypothetical protein
LQVLYCCAQAADRGAAALSQQEKNNPEDLQRKKINITRKMWQGNLAAMYLWRVRVVGRGFASALAHVSTDATPPEPVAQSLGMDLRRPCHGQAFSKRRITRKM